MTNDQLHQAVAFAQFHDEQCHSEAEIRFNATYTVICLRCSECHRQLTFPITVPQLEKLMSALTDRRAVN
jgi:hypothetical protein